MMKIGLITSGSETLTLFKFLTKYDHSYVIYYDFLHWPYGDKTFQQSFAYVQKGITYLLEQGVDCIILPPVYELYALRHPESPLSQCPILPLFTTYVSNYCFAHSLVGKFGLIGDFADISVAQSLLQSLEKTYVLSSQQQAIKKFSSPFHYRSKETSLWKYYLHGLSYSHILVNRIIKHDLRYFKDAAIDTLIPLHYGYFHYQTTITKFLNFKKIRFHSLHDIEQAFVTCITSVHASDTPSSYSVSIAYTGHCTMLQQEKRLLWLLQRGKTVPITWISLV